MKKLSLGLVGCGNMGSELAEFVSKEFKSQVSLRYICEHHPENVEAVRKRLKLRSLQTVDLDVLLKKSDFIIEAACPQVAEEIIRYGVRKRKLMLIMSSGGLLKVSKSFLKKYDGYRLYCPSGAIGGVDALLAAREGKVDKVKLVTSKPFAGLTGSKHFESKKKKCGEKKEFRVFRGSATEAVKTFPKNINVSAVLSAAGVGAKATQVELWASPSLKNNCHEVSVYGSFGKITTKVENIPCPGNPKTSYLAILSAKALLRKIFSPVVLGT